LCDLGNERVIPIIIKKSNKLKRQASRVNFSKM
jgi:hypothetical protein